MRRDPSLFAIGPYLALACLGAITTGCLASCGSAAPPEAERAALAALEAGKYPGYIQDLEAEDPVVERYKDSSTRAATIDFFSDLVGSTEVAKSILDNAERNGVPPSLAFALAYEESRFEVSAVNRNADSIDRGLFQLNSKSFPKLSVREFYDPETNARNGVAHLRYCLDRAGNEVAALAMYNAGHGKVSRGATPQRTLDYISRILKHRENIERLFEAKLAYAEGPRGLFSRLSLGLIQGPREVGDLLGE